MRKLTGIQIMRPGHGMESIPLAEPCEADGRMRITIQIPPGYAPREDSLAAAGEACDLASRRRVTVIRPLDAIG